MAQLEQLDILLVAGDHNTCARLSELLARCDLRETHRAASANAAVARLRERHYDLVLCELELGEGSQDGQHLLEDLRTHGILPRDTLFIMISAARNYDRVVGTAELAPDDYLLKPLNAGILQARLERAAARREAFLPAWRLIEAGRPDEAIIECERGALRHPAWHADFVRLRAEIAFTQGRPDEARTLYQDVAEATGVPWARLGQARMLMAAGRHAEAAPLLEELIDKNEHYLDAYDLLAQCQEKSGGTFQAADTLNDALRRSPRRLDRLRRFGTLAARTGRVEEAEQSLSQLVELGRHSAFRKPADHLELARVQIQAGHAEKAARTVMELERLAKNMTDGPACAALGRALVARETGDENAARDALSDAVQEALNTKNLPLSLSHEIIRACLASGLDNEGVTLTSNILRHAEDEATVKQTHALFGQCDRLDLVEQVKTRLHAEVLAYLTAGANKAKAGDYDGAVSEMLDAVRRMPGHPQVLLNAALALLRHIEHRGWNERFANDARKLIARAQRVDPGHPRLEPILLFLKELQRRSELETPAHPEQT